MTYPLFDTGFTLWAADLDTHLKDRFDTSARTLGVDARMLAEHYYRGDSPLAALNTLITRFTPATAA
jgi:hypothetical protein